MSDGPYRPTLELLYEQATVARDHAYESLQYARRAEVNSEPAHRVWLATNLVRSTIYAALHNGISSADRP